MYDQVNFFFEAGGAVLVWGNVRRLLRDREVKGIDWRVQAFWALWGLQNIWYYGGVGHPLSQYAGMVLAAGNLTWCYIAARLQYGSLVAVDVRRAVAEAERRDV